MFSKALSRSHLWGWWLMNWHARFYSLAHPLPRSDACDSLPPGGDTSYEERSTAQKVNMPNTEVKYPLKSIW
uniref:Putative secreted protein n=1 Tax=Panstrongylus lignarius TaxID=156445 RepID=A0A224Y4L2_9HEMI